MRVGYHDPCSHACIRTGVSVECNCHTDTGKGTLPVYSPQPRFDTVDASKSETEWKTIRDGSRNRTERDGPDPPPPMRLTACTIPSRPYGRPDVCGDQRSISRQSKREREANRAPAHAYKNGKTKRAKTKKSFFVKKKNYIFLLQYIYVRIPILSLFPFFLSFPAHVSFLCMLSNGWGRGGGGRATTHWREPMERRRRERDTERSDIMKLVREREGCLSGTVPLPLSPRRSGPPNVLARRDQGGGFDNHFGAQKRKKNRKNTEHYIKHL